MSQLPQAVRTTIAQAVTASISRVARANQAPRCMHVKVNGVRCGSPALRGNPHCFFHDRLYNSPYEETFPFLEDANAIQLALMQVLDKLSRGRLDPRTANALFYGLQTAASNVIRTRFEPLPDRVVTQYPAPPHRAAPEPVPSRAL